MTGAGFRCIALVSLVSVSEASGAERFRVATYNVENYVDQATKSRSAKSPEAKAKVCESIVALKPDVLALQETGSASALAELRESLKAHGLGLPYVEQVSGADTNVHIAILSKFPFIRNRARTNDNFLAGGRRFRVSRGFGEVDINVNEHYSFTLITAHLKSKRAIAQAYESDVRLEEAKLLREEIDARFEAEPKINLIVLGDFNDSKNSPSTKEIIGRGAWKLIDTRPAELDSENNAPDSGAESRRIMWTHYYPKEDSYSRIDYILVRPGMAREWIREETYVLRLVGWGIASDHRPLVATFEAEDK